MKIGILSMQRVVNYGSFLQAFALKETLKELGHECYFIDIKSGKNFLKDTTQFKKENKINFIVKRIDRYFFKRIKHYFFMKKRIKKFNNEFFPVLGVSKEPNYDTNYDVVVIGSDEVFNCAREVEWGFAKTLIGEEIDSDNIITYAASCGHTTLEQLEQYDIKDQVEKAMKNINAISVRDENTKQFSEKLTGKEIYEHIDPTLIYDFTNFVPIVVQEKNYILIYAYDGRISDKETIYKIREFAKKEKKQVICVGVYQSWCDKSILCSPFELLAYFKNADYIVTDTFHGTVFSIKYNKQFATIIRESNKKKLGYLLKKFNLMSQEVKVINNLEAILKQKPDYAIVNTIIKKETASAKTYLIENTKKVAK